METKAVTEQDLSSNTIETMKALNDSFHLLPKHLQNFKDIVLFLDKNLSIYLKLIDTYLGQLNALLTSGNHGKRSLEQLNLPIILQQLITIKQNVNEETILSLNTLSRCLSQE